MRLHPREAGTRGEARPGTRRGHADASTNTDAGAGRSAWSGVRVHRGVGIGWGWLLNWVRDRSAESIKQGDVWRSGRRHNPDSRSW
jgi:hypothetical protein